MAIRYSEALGIIKQVAAERVGREDETDIEVVSLGDAVGRTAGEDHVSPAATPLFDASTVDGYAISSAATAKATKHRPVTFIVRGSIASGEEPPDSLPSSGGGIPSCFEIKTGTRFPNGTTSDRLDACVKNEDVVPTAFGSQKMITVVEPVSKDTNTRAAGSDIQDGQTLLERGAKIQPRHVMALASAGITAVAVRRHLRIAVWSNAELQTMSASVYFLIAALQELSAHVDFKGVLKCSVDGLSEALLQPDRGVYDVAITIGAVSQDLTPALKALGARIRFDSVAIEPGHPVLSATLPTPHGEVPIISLPGSPGATAACFRFLVMPLVKHLCGLRQDGSQIMKMQSSGFQDLSVNCPPEFDCFKHGWIKRNGRGDEYVQLSPDQNPAKVSHFAASDCWVHVPRGHSGSYRDTLVYCYPHTSGRCT